MKQTERYQFSLHRSHKIRILCESDAARRPAKLMNVVHCGEIWSSLYVFSSSSLFTRWPAVCLPAIQIDKNASRDRKRNGLLKARKQTSTQRWANRISLPRLPLMRGAVVFLHGSLVLLLGNQSLVRPAGPMRHVVFPSLSHSYWFIFLCLHVGLIGGLPLFPPSFSPLCQNHSRGIALLHARQRGKNIVNKIFCFTAACLSTL